MAERVEIFLPERDQFILTEKSIEIALEVQENLRKEGLITWIIWTRGD